MITYQGNYLYVKTLLVNPRSYCQQYAIYDNATHRKVGHILWDEERGYVLIPHYSVRWSLAMLQEAFAAMEVIRGMEEA